MTINTGSAEPAPTPGGTREARRRQHVLTVVMLVAAARTAADKRTLAGVVVLAIGVVAVKRMTTERGFPLLDWYRAHGPQESGGSA